MEIVQKLSVPGQSEKSPQAGNTLSQITKQKMGGCWFFVAYLFTYLSQRHPLITSPKLSYQPGLDQIKVRSLKKEMKERCNVMTLVLHGMNDQKCSTHTTPTYSPGGGVALPFRTVTSFI